MKWAKRDEGTDELRPRPLMEEFASENKRIVSLMTVKDDLGKLSQH